MLVAVCRQLVWKGKICAQRSCVILQPFLVKDSSCASGEWNQSFNYFIKPVWGLAGSLGRRLFQRPSTEDHPQGCKRPRREQSWNISKWTTVDEFIVFQTNVEYKNVSCMNTTKEFLYVKNCGGLCIPRQVWYHSGKLNIGQQSVSQPRLLTRWLNFHRVCFSFFQSCLFAGRLQPLSVSQSSQRNSWISRETSISFVLM